MLFSSITFLYYFLPAVLLLYFLMPAKGRNLVLFLVSLVFYAWGEPKYVFLMVLSVGIGYGAGLLMDKLPKKAVLVTAVSLCLLFLVFFKYTNFFLQNLNGLLGTEIPLLKVVMPIGISFYTFQIISYVIDVYRKTVAPQRNFIRLAAYIAMFPQLIAGPIVRYSDINEQLGRRVYSRDQFAEGIRRFLLGLGKKVLLANQLGELCQVFRDSTEKTILFYWVYAVAVMLHIYFDFSGYSDMAIGLGKILGFTFLENFDHPFMSKSITEFWRRWHMSLGSWFRDYVYIPLGGNRVSKGRHIFNIAVVWMLTGFWHGAEWNFIIWGAFFGVLLIAEKLWLYKKLQKAGGWSRVYCLLLIAISFVIFNAGSTAQMLSDLSNLFLLGETAGAGFASTECVYALRSFGPILLIGIVGATDYPVKIYRKCLENVWIRRVAIVMEPAFFLALMLLCTAYLIDGSFNPFLYFRF